MRNYKGAALWLAALGLSAGLSVSRAAVMTTNVRVTSGQGPYPITYVLGQDISAGKGTMTVNIRKVSDNSIVKTFTVTSDAALTLGTHTTDVSWDGTADGGSAAPVGAYYAEIVTTGAAVSAMTVLSEPKTQTYTYTNPDGSTVEKSDGRFWYGQDVNQDPASPYYNSAWVASVNNGNPPQLSGVRAVNADATPFVVYPTMSQPYLDWLSSAVLSDSRVVLGGQGSGTMWILNPNGTVNKKLGGAGNLILTRNVLASGDSSTGKIIYIDSGSTKANNVGGVDIIDLSEANPTPKLLVDTNIYPFAGRSLAATFDPATHMPTAIWISGRGTGALITKFVPATDGSGKWVVDPNFVFTPPIAGSLNYFVRTSPDGQVLWVAANNGASADTAGKLIEGLDPATGAPLGAAYTLSNLAWDPEEMAPSHNGNLYVTSYAGNITGTTSNQVGVVAPPDNGSTDTIRSFVFDVTSGTTNSVTSGPTVSNLTYHSATVSWETAYNAGTKLEYGSDTSYGTTVSLGSDPTTSHTVPLDLLAAGTTYYYKVTSTVDGLSDATATGQFTTTPLVISNIQIPPTKLTGGSVTITWDTDLPATSYVLYGDFSGTLDKTAGNATLATSHSVTISGLMPGSTYYYSVASGWPGAPRTVSAEGLFTTPNVNVVTTETFTTTGTSATLKITTESNATAIVKFGTSVDALNSTATVAGGGTTTQTVTFSGLTAGTTYYYSLSLSGASIGGTSLLIGTFATPATGGTAKTVTQSTLQDLSTAVAHNLQLGGAGSLLKLEKQGIPGTPQLGPDLPTGNYYSGVTIGRGYMYVVGGGNPTGTAQSTVYYASLNADGTLDTTNGWRTTTPLPAARSYINNQVVAYNGYLYVLGGYSGAAYVDTVYYAPINEDGTVGTWQNGPSLPTPRGFAGVVPVNGYMLLNGGFDAVADVATNFIAEIRPDGSLGPWRATSPLDEARDFHRTVTTGRTVYSVSDYIGSSVAYAPTSPVGELGPFTSSSANLPSTEFSMAAGLLRGKIVVAAGRDANNAPIDPAPINYIKLLQDGSLDFSWSTATDTYPVAVIDLDAATYNGNMYAAGGRTVLNGADPQPTAKTVMIPMVDDPFDATYVYTGQLESGVIDLGGVGSLQHLTVAGTGITATNTEVRYRFAKAASGNGAPVFSDWFTTSGPDAAISGGARYVQYQVILKGDGTATPTVASVTLTANVTSTALPGDVDKNGTPNQRNDVVLALKVAGGLLSATDASVSYENANVAGDATVNMLDVVTIARHMNGL